MSGAAAAPLVDCQIACDAEVSCAAIAHKDGANCDMFTADQCAGTSALSGTNVFYKGGAPTNEIVS
jgi:hypothetical protein